MDILSLMKERRSIRKYQDKQIDREDLEKIIEAGLYAPNAGGGQRARIVAVHNKELVEKIGRLNITRFDRSKLVGGYVSSEQPSIIDNPDIKSGFMVRLRCVLFLEQGTFCTVFPMRSAVLKIWCLKLQI